MQIPCDMLVLIFMCVGPTFYIQNFQLVSLNLKAILRYQDKGIFPFGDKLTLIFCSEIYFVQYMSYGCSVIYYVKKLHYFKVRFGKHLRNSYFTDKKARVDNKQNNTKMPIMLRSVPALSNVALQRIVQFYFFNSMNACSCLNVFCQRSLPQLRKSLMKQYFSIVFYYKESFWNFYSFPGKIRQVSSNKKDLICYAIKATNFH